MLNQFNDDYKQLMLDAENRAKQFGYKNILPQDILLQIAKLSKGNIADFFMQFGIDESVLLDVYSRPPFSDLINHRTGSYSWISDRLRDVIILSLKIAANFQKKQATPEDFLLALFESWDERWFIEALDYMGITPKDFQQQLIDLNRLMAWGQKWEQKMSEIFWPIDEIMHMIEENFSGWSSSGTHPNGDHLNNWQTLFDHNSPQKKKDSTTPALDFFGMDITLQAKEGKIDPVIGRETEIDRLISILNRKTKNNPCLVGDPWVGKTAVIEWLACRIAAGNVPFAMQWKRIIVLDLTAMVSWTKYRWEFEQRIKMVIDEASKLENEVILFIDEIHTIIGAGAGEGSLDAANILKPAMARGKISLIGATTLNEYKKYIEQDSALERRFQKVDVDEPTKPVACEILMGIRTSFEEFHNLIITDEAILDAVELSTRYITDRFLPDKAIDLLDEACSAKSMTYNASFDDMTEIKEQIEKLQKEMNDFIVSQQLQKALAKRRMIDSLYKEIENKKRKRSIPRKDRLKITGTDIQKIVHQTTGVPLKNLQKEDRVRLKNLDKILKKRILWQDEAIGAIVSSLKRSQVGISNQNRPIGSFLFLGPTGVGKTELVKALAEEFYADPKALIKIDMSEYQDRSSASKLIGTTAGYVGYEEGWMLTDRVRRKPYSIVLFDEIEKGNFDVYNLLLQILEDGMVTDGHGRTVNFKNTIVIMTSNLGSEEFNEKASQIGFNTTEAEENKIIADYEWIRDRVLSGLDQTFAPEFLNRIDKMVVFRPIDKHILRKIIVLQMEELQERLEKIGITLEYVSKVLEVILEKTFNPQYGARPVRRFIQDTIEDKIADVLVDNPKKKHVQVTIKEKNIQIEAL